MAATGDVVLEVRNISLAFGGVKALTDISFDVREHEVRAIIGPNGAGKSSMLNCINGVYTPQHGTITFRGQTFGHMDSRQVAEMGIAHTLDLWRILREDKRFSYYLLSFVVYGAGTLMAWTLYPLVQVRMRVSGGNTARIYFLTARDQAYDENKSILFAISADNQMHLYTLEVVRVVQWDGSPNILALGLGIGAILAAYALLLRSGGRLAGGGANDQSQKPEE